MEIFEKKCAITITMIVKNNPGLTKTEVIELVGSGDPKTKLQRMNELTLSGIIHVVRGNGHNRMRLYLTAKGQEVAASLEKIELIMTDDRKWE